MDMNEHDELRDRVARIAYEIEVQRYGGYDWETAKAGVGDGVDTIEFCVPADELDMAYEIADGIIALVEQDVARRLLSGEAVIAAENAGHYDSVLGVHHHCGTDAVHAALAAIGITVEDDV